MLRKYDKFNLSLVNARDIKGNIFPISLKFPLNINEIEFPEDLVAIDVFESHEGLVNGGSVVFSIFIGEVSTINDLMLEINNIIFWDNIEVSSLRKPICFKSIAGKRIVFASLNEQDIVVNNIEQLKEVLEKISFEFKKIFISTTMIQTLSYYGRLVERCCDNCSYGSYGLENGKETLYCRVDEYEHDVLPDDVCSSHMFIDGLGLNEEETPTIVSRVLKNTNK